MEVEFEDVEVVRLFCWEDGFQRMFWNVELPKEHARMKRFIKDHRRDSHQDPAGVGTEMLDMLIPKDHTEWKEIGRRPAGSPTVWTG